MIETFPTFQPLAYETITIFLSVLSHSLSLSSGIFRYMPRSPPTNKTKKYSLKKVKAFFFYRPTFFLRNDRNTNVIVVQTSSIPHRGTATMLCRRNPRPSYVLLPAPLAHRGVAHWTFENMGIIVTVIDLCPVHCLRRRQERHA